MINYLRDKVATFEFWIAKKTLKEGRDFEYQPSDDSGGFVVQVTKKGKYEGLIIGFSKFKVNEVDGCGELTFDTKMISNPKNLDLADKNLVKLTSDIMRIVLVGSIEMVDKNELRKTDTVELDEERAVCEEDLAVPEARVSKRKSRKKAIPGNSGAHPEVQQPTKPKRSRAKATGKNNSN